MNEKIIKIVFNQYGFAKKNFFEIINSDTII
jgi:hypothetical protein